MLKHVKQRKLQKDYAALNMFLQARFWWSLEDQDLQRAFCLFLLWTVETSSLNLSTKFLAFAKFGAHSCISFSIDIFDLQVFRTNYIYAVVCKLSWALYILSFKQNLFQTKSLDFKTTIGTSNRHNLIV